MDFVVLVMLCIIFVNYLLRGAFFGMVEIYVLLSAL